MKHLRKKIAPFFKVIKDQLASADYRITPSLRKKIVPAGGILGVSLSVLGFAYQGNLLEKPFSLALLTPQVSAVAESAIVDQPESIAMAAASPARVMAPQGAFPLQRGMAIVSRLSNPNAGAPGQGSDRGGYVLGVFDIRKPAENGAPAATTLWSEASNTPFRHPQWTNAVMGEVFGVEVDNSVVSNPQVFVGSTGTFVGNINGASQYAGRTIPAVGSDGGDVFRIDGTNGNVSLLNGSIPSVGYNTAGGRGAADITIPLNTSGGGILKSYNILNGGSGYGNGLFLCNVVGSEGGSGGTVWVTIAGGTITTLVNGLAGTGYRGELSITLPAAQNTGSGFQYDITLGYPLQTGAYPVVQGGAGYPNVTNGAGNGAIMGDGVSATFSTTINGGTLTTLNVNAGGSNYSRDANFTINNRYTGVGNIGYNYARKVVYTSSLDNGLIYAIDANTGAMIGDPYDHLPAVPDPTGTAISDIRRLPIGMSWNPRDNRLYFSRVDNTGYSVSVNTYTFTHSQIISVGLNADGSINEADTQIEEMRIPVSSLDNVQLSLITDIEFTSDGNIALLGEMSIGAPLLRSTLSEFRFTKGSHNAIAKEYRYESNSWSLQTNYKVGDQYSGYNNAGGVDFGYGNSENPEEYYDSAVLTGDYLEISGFTYGIQISPLSQGNYPINTGDFYNHYIVDDNTANFGIWAEKTGIGDVDVFSGVDFPTEEIELTIVSQTHPADCNGTDGVIIIAGTGLLPNTPYPVSYVKDGGTPVNVSIVSDENSQISITGLSPGEYTVIQINDPPSVTSNSVSAWVNCPLPELTISTTNPTTCGISDGIITLSGAEASTAYRIEYVKDGGAPVFVNVTSDASGIITLTGLAGGNYTQIRINNDVTGQIGESLATALACLPALILEDTESPTTCTATDGTISLSGAGIQPSTSYRVEYVKDGGASVFVTVTSDASGIISLTGLAGGNYTQVRLNDDVTGAISESITVSLACLPALVVDETTSPTSCTATDGTISLSGAGIQPSTSYRVEYVKDGGAPVFVTVTSDGGGIITLTGLAGGNYTQVRLNDDITGAISESITVSLTCLPALTLEDTESPTTCTATDGTISLSGAGIQPSTSYRVEYVKDGGAPVFVTVTSDGSGIITLTGLAGGSYTQVRLNDDVTGEISEGISVDLTCLPTLSLDTTTNPTTCGVSDGIITLSGAEASTAYRIEYVKDGGAPVFVNVTSDASGIITLTGLAGGNYTQIRINNDVTGQIGESLTTALACLPALILEDSESPTSCSATDGAISLSGAGIQPSTSYRVEYVKDGGAPVFVTVTSDGGGIITLTGLAGGNYTQVRLNDDVTGAISESITVSLACLPALTLEDSESPSTCTATDGTISLSGAGIQPSTSYRVEYVKDGGAPVFVTVTSDGGGIITLTGLAGGNYTQVRLNDDVTGAISESITVALTCLPALILEDSESPSTCTATDGTISLSGAGMQPSTSYRVEYVKDGGAPVFVTVTSDASGIITLTGLAGGDYTQIRLNDEVTGEISEGISVDLTCLPDLTLGILNFPTTCTSADGEISITGVAPATSYRVEYIQDGGSSVFVTLTSDASGILTLSGLTSGDYTQVRLNDELSGQVSNSLTVDLYCPNMTIAPETITFASTCSSLDGIISFSGLDPNTTYRVEYIINGGTSTFADLTSDGAGVIYVTDLGRGIYSKVRINDAAASVLSNAMTVSLEAIDDTGCGPLPVTLVSFEVKEERGQANLSWNTTSETNSDHFEVQYSQDGKKWNTLGRVGAAGESNDDVTYSFVHRELAVGVNYYKLKMIDKDGSYTFSNLQSLVYKGSTQVVILPNPAADHIRIQSNDWNQVKSVKVLDISGNVLYKSGNDLTDVIDTRSLKSGVYLVVIENKSGTTSTHRVIVNH